MDFIELTGSDKRVREDALRVLSGMDEIVGERWREVVSRGVPFPSYVVSDHGRVVSLGKYVGHNSGGLRFYPGREMRGGVCTGGYPLFALRLAGKSHYRQCHSLVAEAFLGPRPEGMFIRHLNGDPSDNRLSNLAYGTPWQNRVDAFRSGMGVGILVGPSLYARLQGSDDPVCKEVLAMVDRSIEMGESLDAP